MLDRHLLPTSPLGSASLLLDTPILHSPSKVSRNKRIIDTDLGNINNNNGGNGINETIQLIYGEKLKPTIEDNTTPKMIHALRILDAPTLEDDYYLNLLDWSVGTNCITVGLQNDLCIWNAMTQKSAAITSLRGNDTISSLACGIRNRMVTLGTKNGKILIVDIEKEKVLIETAAKVHANRIGVVNWLDENCFSSGSRDRSIVHYDLRTSKLCIGRIVSAHEQEICGLKWETFSSFGNVGGGGGGGKLASGGNDNRLLIWDGRRIDRPMIECKEHVAAVKAIAWSPHQRGLLASGGGTADRSIKFWNTNSQNSDVSINTTSTASQVCNLIWSPHSSELVTTHGFSEHLCLRWKYPIMKPTAILKGHEQRVLYTALSPDGTTVVTGSADETIRFWNVFKGREKGKNNRKSIITSHALDYDGHDTVLII